MAVEKATIKTALVTLYNRARANELTEDQFADSMADIIRNAVLSASVTVPGLGLNAGSTPVTGTAGGTLS